MKPTMSKASLLDPKWKYTNAADTDIRKLFARIKRENAERQKEAASVTPIVRARKAAK
jgi:hypothetical protein